MNTLVQIVSMSNFDFQACFISLKFQFHNCTKGRERTENQRRCLGRRASGKNDQLFHFDQLCFPELRESMRAIGSNSKLFAYHKNRVDYDQPSRIEQPNCLLKFGKAPQFTEY